MRNKLIIIGASGHGKVCADIASKMNKWQEIFFLDDDEKLTEVMDIEVIGTVNAIFDYTDDFDAFVAIGNNLTREDIYNKLERRNINIPVLIHPSAIIGMDVKIGEGTVIMAGSVINCSTKINKGCIVNTGSTIDHDCIIEDFVHISPGVHFAGAVSVGVRTWIGIGSTVSNNVTICDDCVVGAGGVVLKNIEESGKYVGVPVRLM